MLPASPGASEPPSNSPEDACSAGLEAFPGFSAAPDMSGAAVLPALPEGMEAPFDPLADPRSAAPGVFPGFSTAPAPSEAASSPIRPADWLALFLVSAEGVVASPAPSADGFPAGLAPFPVSCPRTSPSESAFSSICPAGRSPLSPVCSEEVVASFGPSADVASAGAESSSVPNRMLSQSRAPSPDGVATGLREDPASWADCLVGPPSSPLGPGSPAGVEASFDPSADSCPASPEPFSSLFAMPGPSESAFPSVCPVERSPLFPACSEEVVASFGPPVDVASADVAPSLAGAVTEAREDPVSWADCLVGSPSSPPEPGSPAGVEASFDPSADSCPVSPGPFSSLFAMPGLSESACSLACPVGRLPFSPVSPEEAESASDSRAGVWLAESESSLVSNRRLNQSRKSFPGGDVAGV